jgi:peptide/nickel transport system permease protein
MTDGQLALPREGEPGQSGGSIAVLDAESTGRVMRVFAQNRMAVLGLVALAIIILASIFGPVLSPYDPVNPAMSQRLQPPSLAHPMGTDELGRDMVTRILAGGRLSLAVGGLATVVALSIGVLVGAIAGYAGRWIDNLLMRLVDLALSLPDLFLLILVSALLGPSFGTTIIVISLVRWMNVARLVRASFLSLREREFIESSRAIGARPLRIVLVHLLPNSLSPIIVAGTLGVASAILAESTLSFLGLGIQPPGSSWGSMLRNAQAAIFTTPWLAVFPGLMIFVTVIAINFVGDGLRDALDPSSVPEFRGRRDRIRTALLAERPTAPTSTVSDPSRPGSVPELERVRGSRRR